MEIKVLDYVFWVAAFAEHIALLTVLLRKGRIRRFPVFGSLIGFNILRTITLFEVHRLADREYFYTYWILAAIGSVLELAVFAEVTSKVFRPSGKLSDDVRLPLCILGVLSLAIAVPVVALSLPPVQGIAQWIVLRSDLLSNVLMSEIFAGLTLITVTAGFTWRTHVGVIARGLGFYSLVALIVAILNSHFGVANGVELYNNLSHLQIACYLLCAGYWIVGLTREAPETMPLPAAVESELRRFNTYVASTLVYLRAGRGSI